MICEDCNRVVTAEDTNSHCSHHRHKMPRTHSSVQFSTSFKFYCVALLIISSLLLVSASEDQSQTVVSESEIKTIEPTNNPAKVFVRRRIFRKIVKDASNSSGEEPPTTTIPPATTTSRPRTLYSLVKKIDQGSTVTGSTLKSSMSTSVSLASRQKFNFASLKTRLGLAAAEMTTVKPEGSTTTSTPSTNDSLVMIPLPPNQRKPYTPVIMQVTKSTTSKPTMQTYKLNKMFVPIGIYGKVLENGSSTEEVAPPTIATEIRHKGTDSGESKESSRKHKGIAETVDITYGKPDPQRISLTTEHPDIGLISITTEQNELFGSVMNGLRRGDGYGGYNRNKPYSNSNSGMTIMTPPKLGTDKDSPSTLQEDSYASYASYASYSPSSPHKKFTPSSIVDSITDSMSKIPSLVPSLFHKGLSSLSSLTSSLKENPFVDDNFSETQHKKAAKPLVAGGYTPKIPASVPGGYIEGMGGGSKDQSVSASELSGSGSKSGSSTGNLDLSEYETLEYFRKRPYLLQQMQQKAASSWRRSKGFRFSKGFKPATAPDLLAREYYKTTQMTPESYPTVVPRRTSKHMRNSWLLRNSNEYVAKKNENLVRMWRNMLESFTDDDDDDEEQGVSSSTIASRRSSNLKSPVLNQFKSSIKNKYSKDQINEAKERILTLLNSGYGDEHLLDDPTVEDEEHLQHPLDYDDTSSHMPPPPPPKTLTLTKGLSGAAAGAFKDLVKFFKLGVSVGTGQAREPVNYEKVVDLQEEEEENWKPVRRPLISFSAGISLKNPSSSNPPRKQYHHHHLHHLHPTSHLVEEEIHESPPTTYITSDVVTSPVETYSKPPVSYVDEYAHDAPVLPTTPLKSLSYATYNQEVQSQVPQSLDYDDLEQEPYESNTQSYVAEAPARYNTQRPSNYYDYSTLKNSKGQTWTPVKQTQNLQDYELVPSSLYLNGQNDPRDIAAVVKPAGISDELVRSALPQGLRGLKILDYPNEYASLNSVSQALQQGGGFKNAMKKLRENYVEKESLYLPQESSKLQYSVAGGLEEIAPPSLYTQQLSGGSLQDQSAGLSTASLSSLLGQTLSSASSNSLPSYANAYHSVSPVSSLGLQYYTPQQQQVQAPQVPSYMQSSLLFGANNPGTNVFTTANRINNLGRGSAGGLAGSYLQQQQSHSGVGQKDALGFTSNYDLPQNLDPDIAAILKSELDKDDIPEDVRQEFLEAKEQEKKEKLQQQRQQASRRVDDAQQSLIDSLLNTAIEKSRAQNQYVQQTQYSAPTQPPTVRTTSQPIQYTQPPTHATPTTHQPAQSRSYNPRLPHGSPQGPPPFQLPQQAPPVVATRFFAPIPITPTLMTTAMRNPRYSSPVPRYVIELARKLQTDKSVQGIVRVSAKRGRGLPPIEYLYPVKG